MNRDFEMKIYISSNEFARIILTYDYFDWRLNVTDKLDDKWFIYAIDTYFPSLHNPLLMYDPVKDTQSIYLDGSILQAIQLKQALSRNFKMNEIDRDVLIQTEGWNDDVYFRN